MFFGLNILWKNTLPETNIDPTNGWLEYYFPIGEAYFQGLRTLVSGRVVHLFGSVSKKDIVLLDLFNEGFS